MQQMKDPLGLERRARSVAAHWKGSEMDLSLAHDPDICVPVRVVACLACWGRPVCGPTSIPVNAYASCPSFGVPRAWCVLSESSSLEGRGQRGWSIPARTSHPLPVSCVDTHPRVFRRVLTSLSIIRRPASGAKREENTPTHRWPRWRRWRQTWTHASKRRPMG